VERFDCSYLSPIVYSVRFVVLGATALVTARNTETDRVIESAARGVMDQEEECKYWVDDLVERYLGLKARF